MGISIARTPPPEPYEVTSDSLAATMQPLFSAMLDDLGYDRAPQPSEFATADLLNMMQPRALKIGVPLDTPISLKGFRLGFSMGLLAHPGHPVEVQAYIALVTWLVVLYDDIVGQQGEMRSEAGLFHQRFFTGEPQGNELLEGMADMIREAPRHFDVTLATLIQTSMLHFVTSNLLEQRSEFKNMAVTPKYGSRFPYYIRAMAGLDVTFAIFCFPKALYPDISQFIEAIPDMAIFINLANDVLSFYKEEGEGETQNYVHSRARCEQTDVLDVLHRTKDETVESVRRAREVLRHKQPEYAKSWEDCVRGQIAMHTTNPRYKLSDLGMGEGHPLAASGVKFNNTTMKR